MAQVAQQTAFIWGLVVALFAINMASAAVVASDRHETLQVVGDAVGAMEQHLLRRNHEREQKIAEAHSMAHALGHRPGSETGNGSCAICLGIVELANTMIVNHTNITAEILKGVVCSKQDNSSANAQALCRAVVDIVVHLADFILKEANEIKWAVPETICADILAKCEFNCCLTPATPEQLHLSFATSTAVFEDSDGKMRVTWTTLLRNLTGSEVTWREAGSNSTWSRAAASPRDFARGGWVGMIFTATMSALRAGAVYEYRVGSPELPNAYSDVYTFRTLPLNAGTAARPLRTLALADMGFEAESDATVQQMKQRVVGSDGKSPSGAVDLILHPGDISYSDGAFHGWDLYLRKLGAVPAVVPYMTTPGNHELLYNFSAYRHRMPMPIDEAVASSGALFYAFHVGPLSFLMLDSETVFNTANFGDLQVQWATQVLQQARGRRQLIMALHHRPLYCTLYPNLDCIKFGALLRSQIERAYNENNVAAVMCGHLHAYERTLPLVNGTAVQQSNEWAAAPVYITNGAAGNREGQSRFEPSKPWSAFRTMSVGLMTVELSVNEGSAQGFINATFVRSSDGAVEDTVFLSKRL